MKDTPRPIEVVISDLNRIYDNLSTFCTSYDFYLAVADYCLKLEQGGYFGPIYKEMHEEAKKDMGMYQEAWQKLLEVAMPLVTDLIRKIEDGQIPFEYKAPTEMLLHPLSLQLDGLKSFVMKDQPITSIDSQQDGFYSSYASFIRYIFEIEKQNTIQNHLVTGGEWVLQPYYRAYDDAKDQYQAIREQRPWWAHYQIGRITYAIHKDQYPDTYAQYYDRNDIIDSLYELGVVEAKRGGNESGLFLQRSKYERYIKLLHEFCLSRLDKQKTLQIQSERLQQQMRDVYGPLLKDVQKSIAPLIEARQEIQEKYDRIKSILDPSQVSYIPPLNPNAKVERLLEELVIKQQPVHSSQDVLHFFPKDSTALYRGARALLGPKERLLFEILEKSKNVPLSLQEVVDQSQAKSDTDCFDEPRAIRDAWRRIKTKLQVRRGEYFPITCHLSTIHWIDRTTSS